MSQDDLRRIKAIRNLTMKFATFALSLLASTTAFTPFAPNLRTTSVLRAEGEDGEPRPPCDEPLKSHRSPQIEGFYARISYFPPFEGWFRHIYRRDAVLSYYYRSINTCNPLLLRHAPPNCVCSYLYLTSPQNLLSIPLPPPPRFNPLLQPRPWSPRPLAREVLLPGEHE